MLRDFRKNKLFSRRVALVGGAQVGLISALITRLGYLQIFKYDEYSTKSDSNRIRALIAPAPRGLILDRNAQILATSHHNYRLLLYTENKPNIQQIIGKLSEVLALSDKDQEIIFRFIQYILFKNELSNKNSLLLHFYFKENPDDWSDEKYAKMRARLYYALKTTAVNI